MKKLISIALALAFTTAAHAGNPAAGKDKAKVCESCHGPGGAGMPGMQDFPKLAGQYPDYLVQALRAYQTGARKNAVMAAQAQPLKPADIADLAAYFSSQSALATK